MPALIKPNTLARALRIKPSRKLIPLILKQHLPIATHPQTPSNRSTESLNSKADSDHADNHPAFQTTKSFKLTDFETPITIAALDAEVALLEALSTVREVETKGKELLKKVKVESGARNTGEGMGHGYWRYNGHFHHGLSEAGIPCLPWYW